jgi:hypothetical protein
VYCHWQKQVLVQKPGQHPEALPCLQEVLLPPGVVGCGPGSVHVAGRVRAAALAAGQPPVMQKQVT